MARDRPSKRGPRARWLALGAILLAFCVAGALAWRARSTSVADADVRAALSRRHPEPASLNLVLVTLDTLRADRLGCYGFRGVQTPNIDSLAADGVVFEQATSTAPMTLPSHASILSGLIPPHHGVRDNGGFFLEEGTVTLAERLGDAGYATGAFVGAWVLDSRWGLSQGFDTYSDHFDLSKYKIVNLGTVQKKGDEVMDLALDWLAGVKDRRFFAWIHLYDPHTPYEPPPPFDERYPGQPYLGEIAYTDSVVGRLVAWLRQSGTWDRTLVVLVADHGESLGEHGESTHTFFVYDATQHVPLVVRTPWGDRGRSHVQASTVDVMPTALELLGLPAPEGIDGRSLAPFVLHPAADADRVAYSETYFPRFHFGWQHLRALRNGRYKYVEAPRPELYDLRADPGETRNLFAPNSETARSLAERLTALAGSGAQAAPDRESLDPETLQRLAALGYVGGGPEVDPDAELPDPKDKIGLVARLGEAKALAREEKLEEAVAAIRAIVAEDAGIIDAHVALGGFLLQLRRTDEAILSYKQALALQPDNEMALSELATAYRMQGRGDAAVEGYRRVLEIEPRSPQIWYQLGTLYVDLGRLDEAKGTFEKALEYNPEMGAAYNSLAALAFRQGDLGEAERMVREGLRLEEDLRASRYNLARVLEARGKPAEAERLYREELAHFADNGRARFNLAQLLRERGDRAGYLGELRACTQAAPDFGPAYFFLAREELAEGRLDSAASLARRGLEVDTVSEVAPLGHYVLADVYGRQGRAADARAEVGRAKELEARQKGRTPRT